MLTISINIEEELIAVLLLFNMNSNNTAISHGPAMHEFIRCLLKIPFCPQKTNATRCGLSNSVRNATQSLHYPWAASLHSP